MKVHDDVISEFLTKFNISPKRGRGTPKTWALTGKDINNLLDYYAMKEYVANKKTLQSANTILANSRFSIDNKIYNNFKKYVEFQEKRLNKFIE